MTLIIGIKCSDGVVLGADGATTYASMGRPTIRQPVKSKLQPIAGCMVLGVSGPVGIGQRFAGEVEALWNEKRLSGKRIHEAMSLIRSAFWSHLGPEFEAAQAAQQLIGPVAQQSVLSESLLALPLEKNPILLHFDQQGSPTQFKPDLPFATIGSGQANADPFLAFIRKIFWRDRLPTLVEGIFSVLWTLEHAIYTTPGGVAEPKQIVALGKDCKVRELSDEDLEEHYQAIGEAEGALAGFRDSMKKPSKELKIPEP